MPSRELLDYLANELFFTIQMYGMLSAGSLSAITPTQSFLMRGASTRRYIFSATKYRILYDDQMLGDMVVSSQI